MDNFNDIFKNMDKDKMLEDIKMAKQLATTLEGKKTVDEIMNKGNGGNKDISSIIKTISENPELAEKLKGLF